MPNGNMKTHRFTLPIPEHLWNLMNKNLGWQNRTKWILKVIEKELKK